MGIIRTIIVVSGLAAFIPSLPEDAAKVPAGMEAGANYIRVATGTFSDLAAFCNRQPGVCKTAGYVAYKLERKAKYSMQIIYEWANEAAPPSASLVIMNDPITTGSTKKVAVVPVGFVSQSTIHIDDVIPPWRGPRISKNS
jgi:hypothetical protein